MADLASLTGDDQLGLAGGRTPVKTAGDKSAVIREGTCPEFLGSSTVAVSSTTFGADGSWLLLAVGNLQIDLLDFRLGSLAIRAVVDTQRVDVHLVLACIDELESANRNITFTRTDAIERRSVRVSFGFMSVSNYFRR